MRGGANGHRKKHDSSTNSYAYRRISSAPADNFLELKNNIATFMGLVWVLFGSNCDYYKGLRYVHATMDLRDVMAQTCRISRQSTAAASRGP